MRVPQQEGVSTLAHGKLYTRPMGYRKFQGLLRGLIVMLGASALEAATLTFNSLRRFMPTLGQYLSLYVQQHQATANWQDVPEAAKSSAARLCSVRHSR